MKQIDARKLFKVIKKEAEAKFQKLFIEKVDLNANMDVIAKQLGIIGGGIIALKAFAFGKIVADNERLGQKREALKGLLEQLTKELWGLKW